ncbi:hypothetical protein BH10CYA1_BH10CYA1_59030 [soil metagenome]
MKNWNRKSKLSTYALGLILGFLPAALAEPSTSIESKPSLVIEKTSADQLQLLWKAAVEQSQDLQALLTKVHGTKNVAIEAALAGKLKVQTDGSNYRLEDSIIYESTIDKSPQRLAKTEHLMLANSCYVMAYKLQTAYSDFRAEQNTHTRSALVALSGEKAVLELEKSLRKTRSET